MSETLLFRYYGNKAVLFDEVVAQPFNRLIQAFIEQRPNSPDPQGDARYMFRAVYEMVEQNRDLFTALLSARSASGEETTGPPFEGLLEFYRAGTSEQLKKYDDLGAVPSFDVALGLRLAFGMLISSVLLRDWLFPDCAPPDDVIVATLELMANRALDPPAVSTVVVDGPASMPYVAKTT